MKLEIEGMHAISILSTRRCLHAKGYKLILYVHEMKAYEIIFLLSLGTLVPNSRDSHEKNGYRIFCASKHTLK